MEDNISPIIMGKVDLPKGMTLDMLNECCDILALWEESSDMSYFPLIFNLYGVLLKGNSNKVSDELISPP